MNVDLQQILRRSRRTPPPAEQVWYIPWASILSNLFPQSQGYWLAPQHYVPGEEGNRFPDFGILRDEWSQESQVGSQESQDGSQESQVGSQEFQVGSQESQSDGSQDGPLYGMRTVLIVEIKKDTQWPSGIPSLEKQTSLVADTASQRNAAERLYWIEVIGPHWRYGVKNDNGMDPEPLIDWHKITHNNPASFDHLQDLATLVAAM